MDHVSIGVVAAMVTALVAGAMAVLFAMSGKNRDP
jgi:hypothetical protein